MNNKAICLFIMLIATSLSGCVDSGDGPQFELSSDDIQILIDDNLEDFMNNTSITMVNNNYYNNTTTVIQSSDSGTLHSSSGTVMGIEGEILNLTTQGILVRGDAFNATDSGNSASALNGAKICVGIGTTTEGNMVDWFSSRDISFTSVPVADAAEATAKFIDGSCDAFTGEMSEMVAKKSQLDNDGSMNDVDIWIAGLYGGSSDTNSLISNSVSIIIQQNEDEMLTGFEYIYAQVSLYVTCIDNATDCNPFEYLFQSTTSVTGQFPGSTSKQMSPPSYGAMGASLFTTCSEGVEFFWYSGDISDLQYVFFPGTGLTCTHEFTFNSNQEAWNLDSEFDNYDVDKHIISWSDWTYSLVWESVPIDN